MLRVAKVAIVSERFEYEARVNGKKIGYFGAEGISILSGDGEIVLRAGEYLVISVDESEWGDGQEIV